MRRVKPRFSAGSREGSRVEMEVKDSGIGGGLNLPQSCFKEAWIVDLRLYIRGI
jgi:hypothetical protein